MTRGPAGGLVPGSGPVALHCSLHLRSRFCDGNSPACLFCYRHNMQPAALVKVQWSSENPSESALSGERGPVRSSDLVPSPGPHPWLSPFVPLAQSHKVGPHPYDSLG